MWRLALGQPIKCPGLRTSRPRALLTPADEFCPAWPGDGVTILVYEQAMSGEPASA
jgi:hypothetical protein